jgi:hypothetical protein
MFRILILLAAITTTGVAAFQSAARFGLLGAPARDVTARHWQAWIGNTIVAAILWFVWFNV